MAARVGCPAACMLKLCTSSLPLHMHMHLCVPAQEPSAAVLSSEALPDLNRRLDALQEQAVAKLLEKVRGSSRWRTSQQACWHPRTALHAHSSPSAHHCPSSPLPSPPPPISALLSSAGLQCAAGQLPAVPEPAVRWYRCACHDAGTSGWRLCHRIRAGVPGAAGGMCGCMRGRGSMGGRH